MSKVTRLAYSQRLNAGKYAQLVEQARRLGRVRSRVWDQYGSIAGVAFTDRAIRDRWMSDGTAESFGVLANAWKETVRDAVGDIRAHREATKVEVRRKIARCDLPVAERKRLYRLLKQDQWPGDRMLRRWMRQCRKRGRNHTSNQIIIRADNVRTYTLTEGGNVWLKIPGLTPFSYVSVPLDTTVAPEKTLRVILRGGRVEVHYQIDDQALRSSHRSAGDHILGVDKGYTEALTDSEGNRYGTELGGLLRTRSDELKARNARRAKLRAIANKATQRGDLGKADRIARNNLGTVKKHRRDRAWKIRVRDVTYGAVHQIVDKASVIVAEDLTRPIRGRDLGRATNRRLAGWTKGITAQALHDVSERRGSSLRLVNAAYTSQVVPGTSTIGRRKGDWLYCPHEGGVVWQADHAAAINILERDGDPDISLFTPPQRVKHILQERDRHRSRLPDQDSNTTTHCRCGERNIRKQSASRKQEPKK